MISVDRMSDLLTDPFQRGTARLALTLSPGNTAASARVEPYDFAEHLARFEAEPDPRYVVTALEDVTTATTLTFDYDVPAADGSPITGTADCPIPAGTLAGMSVLVPLGRDQGPAVRLRGLITTTPSPDRGLAAHQLWEVTALLGNLGKLLWIVGWERDALRGQLAQVRRQDRLDRAVGQTLDLVGFDLGVPRFPPLPYAFEDDTVALYHLDEPSGATQARDAQVLYTGVGHPSSTLTATPGAVGRFGSGYAFRDAAAQILVDNHVDFATGPGDDLTVECFVQPDPGAWSGPVVSKHDPAGAGKAGWSLAIGEFGRGLPRNVRATVTDGTRTVIVHADTTLDAGRFHHLALVVDRAPAQVRLYVDGVVRAAAEITQLGALTNAEPLRIGRAAPTAADAFTGVIDEVRLSRAARTGFHAVLGESDEGYRRRLRIFQRWTLPTLDVLQEALNDVVSDVAGEAEPFVIDEQDATLVSAVRGLTVYPAALLTGESIDADGNRRTPESSASGEPDTADFDPLLLVRSEDPRADYAEPAAALMQVRTRTSLDALLDRLGELGDPGRLRVDSAFDPAAGDLRAVGRALLLSHQGSPVLSLGAVAALAHLAGFSWVQLRPDGQSIYASVGPGDAIAIVGRTADRDGIDLLDGQTLALSVDPPLPVGTIYRWSTISCGPGGAQLTPDTSGAKVHLQATAPGPLFVRVEVQRGPRTYAATRRLRVGIDQLGAGEAIAADGSRDPAVAGDPADGFFDPAYLVTFDDPDGAIEADGVNDRRMQPAMADRLRALLHRISDDGGSGTLRLASAWAPGDPGLAGVGRAVTLDPANLSLDAQRLAALAHAVGFSYVHHDAGLVHLLHAAGDMIEITGPDEVKEDEPAQYSLTPRARASAAAAANGTGPPARGSLYVANAGTDTISEIDTAAGTVRRAFKVGAAPAAVAVAPDGSRVYTADSASASVSTVDLASGHPVASLQLGGDPQALRHHPTRPRLYVAVPQLGQLIELDTSGAPTITRALTLGPLPVDVVLTRDGGQAWVVLSQSRRIAVVDTTTMTIVGTIGLGDTPTRVAVGSTRAYVTMSVGRKLAVINVATRTVVTVISGLGTSPGAVAVSDDGQTVYVADVADGGLYLRSSDGSAKTGAGVGGFVPLSGAPVHVELTPARAYVVRQATGDGRSADDVTTLSVDVPGRVLAAWPLGTGHGERLSWSLHAGTPARASLSGTTKPDMDLRPTGAGAVLLRASYLWPDHSPPRTFQVRFSDAVKAREAAGTVIRLRKDDYDLVMNVLNALHPVGVEVNTAELRSHVAELADNLDLFPGYTYPDFRSRRPPPVQPRRRQPATSMTSGTSER